MSAIPRGSGVRFPLPPAAGESFWGYISRVAAHNGHSSRYSLMNELGVSSSKRTRFDLLDVEGVAAVYRQPVSVIAEMLPQLRENGGLALAGETLSPRALRREIRWIAPAYLQREGIDLAVWSSKYRDFCPISWTWLTNKCPGDNCRQTLSWPSTSLFHCLNCGADLRRSAPRYVDHALRPMLSLTYDLGSERWKRLASEHLPPEVRDVAPGVLMELLQVLGATMALQGVRREQWAGRGAPLAQSGSYSEKILRGCYALSHPHKVREEAGERGNIWDITKFRARLRSLSKGNQPLQDAIKAISGIRCLSQEEQENSITISAQKLKIPRSKLRDCILRGGIETNARTLGGVRRIYNDVNLDGLDEIVNDRVSISHISRKYLLDRSVIEYIEECGRITRLDGVAYYLYREAQFKRSESLAFFDRLEALVVRHGADDGRILLSDVMARLPAGPKPWGSVLLHAYLGELDGELGSLCPTGLALKRLTLDRSLAKRLIAGDIDLPRPAWGRIENRATLKQAEDVLGLYPRDIKLAQRAGLLEDAGAGTSWRSIMQFADSYVGTRELSALVSVAPLDIGTEAAKRGLRRAAPRLGAWERRAAIDAFGATESTRLRHQWPMAWRLIGWPSGF